MLYVSDTHSLIWFLTDDKRLGKKAKDIFEKADLGEVIVIIPSIVLAESVHICEKKRATIEFQTVLDKIKESANYINYNLDIKVVTEIANMTKPRDIHDRIIIATARMDKAKLISKDEAIIKSELVDTIWN